MNYIQKDPGAPCSLTEALEYLQVDVLEDLIEKDSLTANQRQPPKNKPHNFTVVAMEGCHSFIILDWARPLKDDMVSGKKCFSKAKLKLKCFAKKLVYIYPWCLFQLVYLLGKNCNKKFKFYLFFLP